MSVIFLLACSAITFESAAGASNPSTPEYSLEMVEKTYEVPTTYSTDPYTGKKVVDDQGFHVEIKSIQVTIKNQNFTPYKDSDGNNISLMYNIRWKGHYSNTEEWYYLAGKFVDSDNVHDYVHASNSDYTIANGGVIWNNNRNNYCFYIAIPSKDGEIDIQVQALTGYSTYVQGFACTPVGLTACFDFTGTSSSWSNTQTIDINKNAVQSTPTPSENTTPQPSTSNTVTPSTDNVQQISQDMFLFGLEWKDIAIALLVAVVAVFAAALVFSRARKSSTSP